MSKVIFDNERVIIQCYKCNSIYVSEEWNDGYVEVCPVCGCEYNSSENILSKWKMFLLRFIGRV